MRHTAVKLYRGMPHAVNILAVNCEDIHFHFTKDVNKYLKDLSKP